LLLTNKNITVLIKRWETGSGVSVAFISSDFLQAEQ
jgi:hypothetical protein